MDMKELKEKYPDLVQEIRQEAAAGIQNGTAGSGAVPAEEEKRIKDDAVKKERERLKAIDEIASQVADEKLVQEAKFGETPMTAQELAFEALRKQRNAGADFMDALNKDAADSGAGGVKPNPNSGAKTQEEMDMEDIQAGAELIAKGWM